MASVAKNTVALYFRTFVTLLVSLFATREVLRILGETDYGIYNVVASVVVFFLFLNDSLTIAVQRFLSFSIGEENEKKTQCVFSNSLLIQLLIVVLVVILSETIGVWFIHNKLSIPIERSPAASIAFHFSVLTFCVGILKVPFHASIIAYERMTFFAYTSIAEAILKLAIVILLQYSSFDNLTYYAFLLFVQAVILFLIDVAYSKKKFSTCKISFSLDVDTFSGLLSFSGWSLFGSISDILTRQGFVFSLNHFAGVVANAAMGVANQVSNTVNSFVSGFQTAFRPHIVKSFAKDEKDSIFNIVSSTSRISFLLIFIPACIVIVNIESLLGLWLEVVPEYTGAFCTLLLVCTIIDGITGPYYCTIMASGSIRNYQLSISSIFLLDFILSLALFIWGVSPDKILYSRIMTRGVLNAFVGIYFMKKQFDFDVFRYLKSALCPIGIYLALILPPLFLIIHYFYGWILFCLSAFYLLICGSGLALILVFSAEERNALKRVILSKLLLKSK